MCGSECLSVAQEGPWETRTRVRVGKGSPEGIEERRERLCGSGDWGDSRLMLPKSESGVGWVVG